jgi:hypothetical protein
MARSLGIMRHFLSSIVVGALALSGLFVSADADACGGCFHIQQSEGGQVTGHRMIFSVSNDKTTLWDQISYQGAPESFAWVLPIHGQVQVGLSSDALFERLETMTAVQIYSPDITCPSQNCDDRFGGSGGGGGAFNGTTSDDVHAIRHRDRGGDGRAVRDGAALFGGSGGARAVAGEPWIRDPGRHPPDHRRVRERGLRLPRDAARAGRGGGRDAACARDVAGRGPRAAAAHGGGGDGRDHADHAVGHGGGAVRAVELPDVPDRGARRRVELGHDVEQLLAAQAGRVHGDAEQGLADGGGVPAVLG